MLDNGQDILQKVTASFKISEGLVPFDFSYQRQELGQIVGKVELLLSLRKKKVQGQGNDNSSFQMSKFEIWVLEYQTNGQKGSIKVVDNAQINSALSSIWIKDHFVSSFQNGISIFTPRSKSAIYGTITTSQKQSIKNRILQPNQNTDQNIKINQLDVILQSIISDFSPPDPKPVGEYTFSNLTIRPSSYVSFSSELPKLVLAPNVFYKYSFNKGIEYHGNDPQIHIQN